MSKRRRDEDCRCGSGKKYKKCCKILQSTRQQRGHWSHAKQYLEKEGQEGAQVKAPRCKLWQRENWEV